MVRINQNVTILPWSVYVLTAFGIVYVWILHRVAVQHVYRLTGIYVLDAYILVWILGLGKRLYSPLFLYLAFGFKEFADTPTGNLLTERLHWTGRAQALFFVCYAVFILTTVRQRSDSTFTIQDLQQTIVWNVAFTVIAIFFAALASLLRRRG